MKPTTTTELTIAIHSIIEAVQNIAGSFDSDKNVGITIDRLTADKFRITFRYITVNRPVPPMVNPSDFDGTEIGDYYFDWLTSDSLQRLVKDVYDAYDHIQAYTIEV